MTESRIPVGGASASGAVDGRLTLLVLGESGVVSHFVQRGTDTVVGRDGACDVCLDDLRLSRRHLTFRIGERIHVIDNGSLNGTSVGGRRITAHEPVEVALGEQVSAGSFVLSIQRVHRGARARRIWSHGYFEARLDEECARSKRSKNTFAVLRLLASEGGAAKTVEMVSALVRPMDVVATYSPEEIEILVVDVGEMEVTAICERIRAAFHREGRAIDIGVAFYPKDGMNAEDLIASSRGRGESPESRVAVSATVVEGFLARVEPLLERIAMSPLSVLILGETGVGKEVIARTVHDRSNRADRPMVCINCAALAESLLEAELFGHERGAFTGAINAKAGLLEAADGGTVFLDEVGEMPLALQAKILRALEQREVVRLGAIKPRTIDVRFVAATNRDLEREVSQGRFRQDLYFRLNGISLTIPPLRERQDEIEPLAKSFARRAGQTMGKAVQLTDEALVVLRNYAWPGNIRELKNVIDRAVVLSETGRLGPEHMGKEAMMPIVAQERRESLSPPSSYSFVPRATEVVHVRGPGPVSFAPTAPSLPPRMTIPGDLGKGLPVPAAGAANFDVPKATSSFDDDEDDPGRITQVDALASMSERDRIIFALERSAGNQTRAAEFLGISRRTLVSRLAEYSLPRPRKREP